MEPRHLAVDGTTVARQGAAFAAAANDPPMAAGGDCVQGQTLREATEKFHPQWLRGSLARHSASAHISNPENARCGCRWQIIGRWIN